MQKTEANEFKSSAKSDTRGPVRKTPLIESGRRDHTQEGMLKKENIRKTTLNEFRRIEQDEVDFQARRAFLNPGKKGEYTNSDEPTDKQNETHYCFVCWHHHSNHQPCMKKYLESVDFKDAKNHEFKMECIKLFKSVVNATKDLANGSYETQIL